MRRRARETAVTLLALLVPACASAEPPAPEPAPPPSEVATEPPAEAPQPAVPAPEPEPAPIEWVSIASIGGLDAIAAEHITNTLRQHGIPVAIGGSVIYGVEVPAEHAELAARLLRHDPLARAVVHYQPPREIGAAAEERLDRPREYAELLAEHPEGTPLGTVLRQPYVAEKVAQAPRVTRIEQRTLPYLAADGSYRDGYSIKVTLEHRDGQPRSLVDARYQVWDDGAQVIFLGGSAAGAAAN